MRFCPNCRNASLDSRKRAQMLCRCGSPFQRRRCCLHDQRTTFGQRGGLPAQQSFCELSD